MEENNIDNLNNEEILSSKKLVNNECEENSCDEEYIKYGSAEEEEFDVSIDYEASIENKKEKRKPRKQQIIDDIKELSRQMGIECQSDNKLNKAKITALEERLGKLVNKSLTCNLEPKVIQKSIALDNSNNIVKKDDNVIPDDMLADSLYNINFLLVNSVETISNSFNLPVSLKGLTQKMDETKRDDLKKVLVKIVGNHGNVLKPLMSPLAMYAFIMLVTIQDTIKDNLKKKSDLIK